MAKQATVWAGAVEVICPTCDECIGNPEDGAHLWDVRTYQHRADSGEPIKCYTCGEQAKVPARKTARIEGR